MSIRSKRNRKLLLWRIAFLALSYAVPLGGLAFFFLLSGVRWRIAAIEKERLGLVYVRQLAVVHDLAVQSIWTERPAGPAEVTAALTKLDAIAREVMPRLATERLPGSQGDFTAAQLRATWDQSQQDTSDHAEQVEEVTLFLGQIQAHLAETSDRAGLTSSPDLETEYVGDLVAATLSVHIERLLQMHEQLVRLAPQERARSEHLSTVFLRQLERELPRLDRSLRLAADHDAHSSHVAVEFQRVFPPAAGQFRQSLLRLAEELRADGNSAAYWDGVFVRAHIQAVEFWQLSISQLDVLLADQIAHAERERNIAIAIAAFVLVTLVPLTWAYFRRYVRPLVQDLVDEVQENADAAARAKNQFLAMMSHEIRTPMNGVIGFANLLGETKLDEQQRDFVRTITSSSEALLTIINDILDYTKLEADRIELEARRVSVRELVEDVLGLLGTAANAKQLELVYWIEPDVPEVILGDPTRLRQILLNLAGNAVKFTAAGHVQILIVRPPGGGDRVEVRVSDTGIGIPPGKLDRLFKPFSQVDSSVTRTHGGTGLGLAIARRLVVAMGGEIAVTSEPGRGTEFSFNIPAPPAEAEAPRGAELSTAEIDRLLHGRRILVVDDAPANRHLVEKILEPHGAVVVAVESPAAAQEVLATQSFELGILDYMLPGMDGIALAEAIAPEVPRLMLVTSVLLPAKASGIGRFAAVLTKPIRNRKFLATVVRVLHGEKAAAEAAPPAPEKAPPFALQHPLRLLAVDDNPVNLKVISMMLTSLGYAPVVADRGESALARLRTDPFDLVLMDVQMPGMDGLEATRTLRRGDAGERNRGVRVVALTAGAMPEERAACSAAGMNDFLAKPISRPELLAILAGKR